MKIQHLRTSLLPVWHAEPPITPSVGENHSDSDQATQAIHRHHVIVLGNAYGVMPYQGPIAVRLAEAGYQAYWAPLRGQPESFGGEFCIRGAAADIGEIIDTIQRTFNSDDPIYLIGHCASSLAVLEFLRSSASKDNVRGAILYSPLTNHLRIANALPRLANAGVTHALTSFDLTFSAAAAATNLSTPILIVEVKDELNRRRTTHEEIVQIRAAAQNAQLCEVEHGYDDNLAFVDPLATIYSTWLTAH